MEKRPPQASLSNEDALAAALQYLSALEQRLDLRPLSTRQRSALPKLHQGHTAFVAEIRDICLQRAAFLPAVFDLSEFDQTVVLAGSLKQLQAKLTRLNARVSDTLLAVEGDSYISALEAYGYLQAADGGGELDADCRQLRQFFRRNHDRLDIDPDVYS